MSQPAQTELPPMSRSRVVRENPFLSFLPLRSEMVCQEIMFSWPKGLSFLVVVRDLPFFVLEGKKASHIRHGLHKGGCS